MAAKSRTKRKTSSIAANPAEKPWQLTVKPTKSALVMMRMRDECLAILDRFDAEAITEISLRASDPVEDDPVAEAAADVLTKIDKVARLAKIIDDQRGYVLATGDDKRGRISSLGSCAACTRDVACTPADRLKAGYCSACYTAWIRAGRPERRRFEIDRYNA